MNPSIMERGMKIDYDTSNTSSVQERGVIFHGIHSVRRYLFWLSLTLTSLRTSKFDPLRFRGDKLWTRYTLPYGVSHFIAQGLAARKQAS